VSASRSLKERAYHEFQRFLVYTLYLWLVFSLFITYRSVVCENHLRLVPYGLALVNALALAKIALVAKALHLGDQVNDAPLVYTTLVKAALFTLVLVCFKVLEDVAVGHYRGKSFQQSLADLGGGTWTGILSFVLIMLMMLIPLVGWIELQRVLGEEKFKAIFFVRRRLQDLAVDR